MLDNPISKDQTSLALARRYRPRTLQTVVGQETIVRALSNALDTQRLHHAYLFTGTRGVGKTSFARILAKCLNCEKGISSQPCGTCYACSSIDEGRFVDLLEVDAASRTKVEDTRELLDNVQYLPTRGRFKIYLIDEVHMLSTHSFNALLKTLEEPPPHVKFLLATTDPQKLPLTILSRCLQFHLHRLTFCDILNHLKKILHSEQAAFDDEALRIIAGAAEGSMRDALSLLDQAIAYSHGNIQAEAVRAMLGMTSKDQLLALLAALIAQDAQALIKQIQHLATFSPDFTSVLNELLILLHQVALAQKLPELLGEEILERAKIIEIAQKMLPEEVQLYYQIALLGNRDLPYAPNAKMGFEMVMLRMLAFQPVEVCESDKAITKEKTNRSILPPVQPQNVQKAMQNINEGSNASSHASSASRPVGDGIKPIDSIEPIESNDHWPSLLNKLNLSGLVKELANNCSIESWTQDYIHLVVDAAHSALLNKRNEERLGEAIRQYLQKGDALRFKISLMQSKQIKGETPAQEQQRLQQEDSLKARKLIESNPKIQHFMQTFDAEIEQSSMIDDIV